MLLLLSLLCGLVSFTFFLNFYWENKKFFDFVKKRGAKGPVFLPFIGVTSFYDVYKYMKIKFSFPAFLWIQHDFYYFTSVAEEMKILMNSPHAIDKANFYHDELGDVFGNSIVNLPGHLWKHRRRLNMKSFTPNILKKIIPVINERSEILVKDISNKKDDQCLYEFFDFFFSRNSFAILFGFTDNDMEGVNQYTRSIIRIQETSSKRALSLMVPTKIWRNLYPEGRKTWKVIEEAWELVRKAARKALSIQTSNNEMKKSKMLPHLETLVNDPSMTEETIVEELVFFMAAATDTSGHALAVCVTLLGMYPEIQDKVFQEVESVVKDGPITQEDLLQLQYTECVIWETLRVFPVVPAVARYITKDIDLGTAVLPKGSNVLFCIFDAHYNEKYWPDPLKFDPNRFLPENSKNNVPYSFLPFSGGARDCVAKAYALQQLKITLANIVRNFKIVSSHKSLEDLEYTGTFTIKTKKPLDCRFYKRALE